jgi:hypothetical protein
MVVVSLNSALDRGDDEANAEGSTGAVGSTIDDDVEVGACGGVGGSVGGSLSRSLDILRCTRASADFRTSQAKER